MVLALAFGAVALFLAAIGIYGVLAYQVSQRRARSASGWRSAATPHDLRPGHERGRARPLAAGFAVGLAGAFAIRRSLAAQLYGVPPMDPMVVALVAAVLGLVGLLACAIPARRAAKIDPLIALTDQ